MRVPKNKIKTNQYTSGNEFVKKETNESYQGYYYIFNNKFYVGKEFDPLAVELIKIQQQNQLYNSQNTALFSFISGITSQRLSPTTVSGIPITSIPTTGDEVYTIRYFSQKVNVNPPTIKEINKETYDSISTNPLYRTTFIDATQDINKADQQLPGLKAWLEG